MSIYGVGNLKGGVGKTTTAINLVVALAKRGRDVLLVDAENTAMEFTELRESILGKDNVGDTAIELHGAAIRTQVRALTSKYADIVIDIGGEDASGSLRAALTVVEMLAVPVNPRSFDLWRTEATGELVTEAREINDKLRAVAFLNEADPSGPENNETLERLAKIEAFEVAPLMIGRRKAIPRAQARGFSIFEFHEDPKATQEFSQLVDFLAESNVHTSIAERNHMAIASRPKRITSTDADQAASAFIAKAAALAPVPEIRPAQEYRKPTMIRIPPHVLAKIDISARRLGISRSAFIVQSAVEKIESMG